jgi:hypothetical protein
MFVVMFPLPFIGVAVTVVFVLMLVAMIILNDRPLRITAEEGLGFGGLAAMLGIMTMITVRVMVLAGHGLTGGEGNNEQTKQ